MKECSVDDRVCERCGENDHLKEKSESVCVCRNFKLKRRRCDRSVECPEYVRMLESEKARTSDDWMALRFVLLNCHSSCAVMNDLSRVLVYEKVNVALL